MGHDNAPPIRRHAVKELIGHMILIGAGLWLWKHGGPWWGVGMGLTGLFTVTMIKPLWQVAFATKQLRQQKRWDQEATVIMRGKTAALADDDEPIVHELLSRRSGAIIGVIDE